MSKFSEILGSPSYATETWTKQKMNEDYLQKENLLQDIWSNVRGRAVMEEMQ